MALRFAVAGTRPRYTADQVCVIPGTVAVAGITRVDEPVGELLDRFEKATYDELVTAGASPLSLLARRHADIARGLLDTVLSAPDIQWASRLTLNPVRRLGDLDKWSVESDTRAVHETTGAELSVIGDQQVLLTVPLVTGKSVQITITVPASVADGGAPLVTEADAEKSMTALLAVAAGQELPAVKNGVARLNLAWTPDLIADHAGVTGSGLPTTLSVSGKAVPDVVVGACWPAVFAVLGAAKTEDSLSVIEGMLDLVHLDHSVDFVGELPSETSILVVKAEVASVLDTDLGRVVEVKAEVGAMLGEGLDAPAVVTPLGALRHPRPHRQGRAVRSGPRRWFAQ